MATVRGRRRDVLEMYRRTRPGDVPAEMIEAATARRLAGDPAGACAAARVDLDVDVTEITRVCGRESADRIVDDLHHVAPDLLRWNIPRGLDGPGTPIGFGLLRRYPDGGGVNLLVIKVRNQPDRLRLWAQCRPEWMAELPDRTQSVYHLPQAYWDARYTGELRDLCGGGPDRIPFHDTGGRLLESIPIGPPPEDPVAMTEWLTLLWDEGRVGEALAACGITLADGQRNVWRQRPWVAAERLVADARRVLDEGVFAPGLVRRRPPPVPTIWVECRDEGQAGTDIELAFGPGDRVTARRRSAGVGESRLLTAPEYRHPIDLDLLRFGLVGPDELHPAVAQALFPARSPRVEGPSAPRAAVPRDGGRELMERAFHRDTAGVCALLDAGADPLVRDRSGQTLLHLLPHLDHELLLARLLAAGVDVNAVDVQGRTALHAAAARKGELEHAGWLARESVEDLIGRLLNAGGVDVCAERGAPCPAGAPVERRARPTGEDVDRLRGRASRGDYPSMARLAWALYSTGKNPREVLAECYGVPFPDEFFALADRLPLPGHRPEDQRCHVWRLALPADRGGPVPADGSSRDAYANQAVLERDRRLIPVLPLRDPRTEYGGLVLCYRLTELARGEPTVFGIDRLDDEGQVERLGPSLAAVLRDYHATVVDRLEALRRLAPEHTGVDTLPAHRAALNLAGTLLPAGAPGVTRSEPTAPFTAPAPGRTVTRLRSRASRGDYSSMARLAWALYSTGKNPREVLSECYGVPFPEEFFVIAEADPDGVVPGRATTLPWDLTVPLERGGPMIRPTSMTWADERRIFAWDPDLVPLVALDGDARWDHRERAWRSLPHGDLIHCYRLSELAAGRSTVVSVPGDPAEGDAELFIASAGGSLLAVLHQHAVAQLRLDEWEIGQPWNRGAGSIHQDEVEGSRENVAKIEALQRRLDERSNPTGR
ncbi:ankyrin repeat domain-containing protein [Spirillospora sp. CA-294931]|uniref:ankyrin repeat domain-containing protein n=1 Tax=Spirillospora sp. CA-294931 TaxID=3240042 RepID=UPI003D8FB2B3